MRLSYWDNKIFTTFLTPKTRQNIGFIFHLTRMTIILVQQRVTVNYRGYEVNRFMFVNYINCVNWCLLATEDEEEFLIRRFLFYYYYCSSSSPFALRHH